MCHSDDSRPPSAGHTGSEYSTEDLMLQAQDGNRLAAYVARPAQPTGAGIVVMPDVRGLHEFYRQLVERFAEVGVDAVAIDYFGRTAETSDRSASFDFAPHVQQATPAGVAADVAAATEELRRRGARAVFTVGFCFGGGYSWRQSADTPGLSGAIGFYGRAAITTDATARMTAPLLMLIAGADAHIPVSDAQDLASRAREAGVEAEVVVYEGAPHSFFDRSFAEHEQDCADAWDRIRSFLAAHG